MGKPWENHEEFGEMMKNSGKTGENRDKMSSNHETDLIR